MSERDRVWAGVIRVSNEQAGFTVDDISSVCDELYGEDAPTVDTIDDTVDAMVGLGVLEPFGIDGGSTYYLLDGSVDDA